MSMDPPGGPVSYGHLDDLPPWARAVHERERAGHLRPIDGGGHPHGLPGPSPWRAACWPVRWTRSRSARLEPSSRACAGCGAGRRRREARSERARVDIPRWHERDRDDSSRSSTRRSAGPQCCASSKGRQPCSATREFADGAAFGSPTGACGLASPLRGSRRSSVVPGRLVGASRLGEGDLDAPAAWVARARRTHHRHAGVSKGTRDTEKRSPRSGRRAGSLVAPGGL
jgi:hypothetical protein